MLPAFAKAMGLPCSSREGWLTGCFERMTAETPSGGRAESGVELGVCVPVPQNLDGCRAEVNGALFYGFTENLAAPEIYDSALEGHFARILEDFRPDMVHIFGTEFPHALAMTKVYGRPERTLIGIQGLCSAIAEAYMADLPYKVQKRRTFRDRLRKDSLREQKKKFERRAVNEKEAILLAGHVTGRTRFDREEAARIHPDAAYHQMNETLRPEFYGPRWDLSSVRRHTIFLSQGDYPLKGFHYVLEAMPLVRREFPDAMLFVAGNSVIGNVGGQIPAKRLPEPIWISEYGRYLKDLIRDGCLEGHVVMLGTLTAEEMLKAYLKSHLFICPSSMENSPNSLCEAMLLGMPVIASHTGGIPSLVENGSEGLLFPVGNVQTLAEDICNLFEFDQFACRLGSTAHKEAVVRHNPDTNYHRLLEIYRSICR